MKKKTEKKDGALTATVKGLKNVKKPFKITMVLLLVTAIVSGSFFGWKWYKTKNTAGESEMSTSTVMRGNLVNTITGSGTVEPIEQRDIVPEVNGKILESPFKEGDSVKAGDVLYKFEMTTAQNAIKTASNNVTKAQTTLSNKQKAIEKAREDIADLTIVATAGGKIEGLSLRVGESAPDKICTITDYKSQTATIPFNTSQIESISVGDSVTVAVDKYMMNIEGRVERKYTSAHTLSNGAVVHNVEIKLGGDYVVEENLNVTATVHTASGDIESASYGSVAYEEPVTVSVGSKGNVAKVNVKNGDWIEKGQVIAILENDDLTDALADAQQSYKDAEMSLTEARSNLEDKEEAAKDYIVESPIDGVILTKDYNVGDTINGQNAPTMMVIADMSKMKFTISADELDISKIQLGQSVQVTADALEGQQLQGTITNVSKLGTASNGVTNYPIEVTIDEPGELMPGMNVSAEIIIEEAYDTLYLPVEAVEYFGGKYYVTVVGKVENMPEMPSFGQRPPASAPSAADEESGANEQEAQPDSADKQNQPQTPSSGGERPQGMADGQMPQRGERQQGMADRQMPQRSENVPNGEETTQNAAPAGKESDETAKNEKEESTDSQTGKSDAEGAKVSGAQNEKSQGENVQQGANRQGGSRQREEIKINYTGKEERVEVQVGIVTEEYYEIKSGVEYGQVVKNTTQTTGSSGNMMGGRMPGGMGGGMPGGMGGGMPGGMGGGMPGGAGGMRGGR